MKPHSTTTIKPTAHTTLRHDVSHRATAQTSSARFGRQRGGGIEEGGHANLFFGFFVTFFEKASAPDARPVALIENRAAVAQRPPELLSTCMHLKKYFAWCSFTRGEKGSRTDLAQQPRFGGTGLHGGNHLQRTRLPGQRGGVRLASVVRKERFELFSLEGHNHDVLWTAHGRVSHVRHEATKAERTKYIMIRNLEPHG